GLLLQHVSLLAIHGAQARYRTQTLTGQRPRGREQTRGTPVATENAIAAEEVRVDRSKMHISDTDVAIEIIGMHKWYGDFHVLKDINLKVMRGERIVVCGPSGS